MESPPEPVRSSLRAEARALLRLATKVVLAQLGMFAMGFVKSHYKILSKHLKAF